MTHAVGMGHQFNFFAQTSALFNFWNFGGDHKAVDPPNGDVGIMTNRQDTVPDLNSFSAVSDPTVTSKERDLIVELPGLYFDPGFAQYSGYFNVDPTHNRNLFYWYVESQGNPETDPVIWWSNGGPGCSGLYAFAVEHGPFFWTVDGVLFANPYSWNLHANILYVESPVGVGFSYSDVEDDYITGDAQTALDNYVLIRKFLERFPERKSNDFYIASESYGGHYIPGCKCFVAVEVKPSETTKISYRRLEY
jgi:carboxypeptidase C (cathepsin A)